MAENYLDKLIDIIATTEGAITFLHNTSTSEIAEQILIEGFDFQSHLDYCTDVVSAKDSVTIKYFTIVRQAYGNYTIIIQISKDLIEEYSKILDRTQHHFSEIITLGEPYLGNDEEQIYRLAPQFVRGFINAETAEFISNPTFDSAYQHPQFKLNLKRVLKLAKQ